MMRKNAYSEIVNFMAPGSEVLVLRHGSNDYIGLGNVIEPIMFLELRFVYYFTVCYACYNCSTILF